MEQPFWLRGCLVPAGPGRGVGPAAWRRACQDMESLSFFGVWESKVWGFPGREGRSFLVARGDKQNGTQEASREDERRKPQEKLQVRKMALGMGSACDM